MKDGQMISGSNNLRAMKREVEQLNGRGGSQRRSGEVSAEQFCGAAGAAERHTSASGSGTAECGAEHGGPSDAEREPAGGDDGERRPGSGDRSGVLFYFLAKPRKRPYRPGWERRLCALCTSRHTTSERVDHLAGSLLCCTCMAPMSYCRCEGRRLVMEDLEPPEAQAASRRRAREEAGRPLTARSKKPCT